MAASAYKLTTRPNLGKESGKFWPLVSLFPSLKVFSPLPTVNHRLLRYSKYSLFYPVPVQDAFFSEAVIGVVPYDYRIQKLYPHYSAAVV